MELNYFALPGALLALIGVIAVFMKIGRKDQQIMDHTNSIKEHEKMLKQCGLTKTVTAEECAKTQGACIEHQKEANTRIIKDIAEIKQDIHRNRTDLVKEMKEDRDSVHKELLKLNNVVGEINGLVGRLRFDNDGRVIR